MDEKLAKAALDLLLPDEEFRKAVTEFAALQKERIVATLIQQLTEIIQNRSGNNGYDYEAGVTEGYRRALELIAGPKPAVPTKAPKPVLEVLYVVRAEADDFTFEVDVAGISPAVASKKVRKALAPRYTSIRVISVAPKVKKADG